MNQMDKYYKTSDSALAAWLVYRGCEILGAAEIPGDRRKQLIFLNSQEIDSHIYEWNTLDNIEAQHGRRYYRSMSVVKRALKSSLNVEA